MRIIFLIALSLLGFSCNKTAEDQGTSEAAKKTYTVYEFGNVEGANLQSTANRIHSVTSSKQGKVYVAGLDSSNKVVVDRTDGQSWIKMNIATGKTPADANVKVDLAVVDADANVSTTASLMDGVLVFESKRTGIMAILNDDSTDAITAWAPEQSGIDHQFLTFLEVENNNNRYIYGSTYTTVSGHDSQANGLRFFQVGSTTKNAWEDGFTEFDGKPLIRYFTSFALNLNGDLLLGTNNNGAIYEIAKNTFGAASGQRKLKNIAPLVKQTDLRYDVNVQNQAIRHMLQRLAKKSETNFGSLPKIFVWHIQTILG